MLGQSRGGDSKLFLFCLELELEVSCFVGEVFPSPFVLALEVGNKNARASYTRIKPLPLANGHGRYIAVAVTKTKTERKLVPVGE